MRIPVTKIHGHTIYEIQHLLHSTCEHIQKDVVLDTSSLGGWSNINIQGTSEGTKFVLKLPWSIMHFDTNPYSKLGSLLTSLSRSKLATPPMAVGRLPDKNETPYMLLHYLDGTTYSSISNASREELQALKDTLHQLSLQKPSGLRKYVTPFDYLTELYIEVTSHNALPSGSTETMSLVQEFQEQYTKLSSKIEALGIWSGTLMHGDLWEPNILFQDGQVILLDFESCSYGDSIYDLAYLLEASDGPPIEELPVLLYSHYKENVNSFRPIALMALIGWSLDRLLFLDAGLVEQNLSTPKIRKSIVRYTQAKISRLASL